MGGGLKNASASISGKALCAEKLRVIRGGQCLLDISALALPPGKLTAILGPNGAGKTTLLTALAGLLPESSAVSLGGAPLSQMEPNERARALGYLPQNPAAQWDIDVTRLIGLGRLPFRSDGEAANRAAVHAITERMGLEQLAQRAVSSLSGGELARAHLARALVGDPRWLLADEPLAALDLAQQAAMLGAFKAAAKAGTGVVMVLHDLAQAMNHADHVVVLNGGAIACEGEAEAVLTPRLIREVWGVDAHWLGEPGARALLVDEA